MAAATLAGSERGISSRTIAPMTGGRVGQDGPPRGSIPLGPRSGGEGVHERDLGRVSGERDRSAVRAVQQDDHRAVAAGDRRSDR